VEDEMSKLNIDRRAFLRRASSTALTLPLIGLGVMELTSCASANSAIPSGGWKTTICPANEPGEPLIITGTIYAPDGRTPIEAWAPTVVRAYEYARITHRPIFLLVNLMGG